MERVIRKYSRIRFVRICIYKAPKVTDPRSKHKGVSIVVWWWRKDELEHVLQRLTLSHIFKSASHTVMKIFSNFEPKYRFLIGGFLSLKGWGRWRKQWQSLSQHCSIRACHSSCSAVFRQIPGRRKPKFFVAASSSRTDGWWWCKIGPFQLETEKTVKVIACWRKRTTAAF